MQARQWLIIVIKDKNNSLLSIKLYSGRVTGGTVTAGVESSVDFIEAFSFYVDADLFTTFSVPIAAAFSLLFVTFSLKYFLFFLLTFYMCFKTPFPMKNNDWILFIIELSLKGGFTETSRLSFRSSFENHFCGFKV